MAGGAGVVSQRKQRNEGLPVVELRDRPYLLANESMALEMCIDGVRRGILNRNPMTSEPWRMRFLLSEKSRKQMAGSE
jgi:hypothetical protein